MAKHDSKKSESPRSKCRACNWNCLQAPYQRFLYRYGRFVGRHPWWFIVIPFIICLGLASGIILNMTTLDDATALYTPKNSQTLKNEKRIKELFPLNSSWEFVQRASVYPTESLIMVEAVNGNVLDEKNLAQFIALDLHIRQNITTASGKTFEDLCARWHGHCVSVQPVFALVKNDARNINNENITLPSIKLPHVEEPFLIDGMFGQTTLDTGGKTLLKARYMSWSYAVRADMKEESDEWLTLLYDVVESNELQSPDINVWMFNLMSVDKELKRTSEEITPQFLIAIVLIIVFSVVTCLMLDPVRSKPLLANAGVLSPGLALGGAFGLLFFIGEPFTASVALVPFLVIAIGVDGMFVLVSAWRHSSPYLPVEERMALTFQEGGVSITITALTDMVGMAVGIVNPFRSIELFCRFATLATAFDLILQLTFFGGCLALFGRREGGNRHSLLLCKKLPAPSQAQETRGCSKLLCVGGVNKSQNSPLDNKEHLGNRFFAEYVAKWIRKPGIIVLAVLLYFAYIGGAVYGCLNIQEGLRREDIALKGSKYQEMIGVFVDNFQSQRVVMLIVDEPLIYSSHLDRGKVFSLLFKLIQAEETNFRSSISWLQEYSNYLEEKNIQVAHESKYIDILRNEFLTDSKYQQYKVDILFNSNYSGIIATRIYVIGSVLETTALEKRSYEKVKEITEDHELNAFMFSSLLQYTEQYVLIVPNTIQILGIATLAMLVIALLLLPNPLISFIVTLSIVSIEAGILGYMSLWDVRLDIIAMMNMLISVGFVVDFSAHLAYAFVTTTESDRLKHAMSLIGYPLVQSSVSTIIGVVSLAFSLAAMARAFFKIMLILMIAGTIHGILWIPIVLHLIYSCATMGKKGEKPELKEAPANGSSIHIAPQYSVVQRSHRPRVSRGTPSSLDEYIDHWHRDVQDSYADIGPSRQEIASGYPVVYDNQVEPEVDDETREVYEPKSTTVYDNNHVYDNKPPEYSLETTSPSTVYRRSQMPQGMSVRSIEMPPVRERSLRRSMSPSVDERRASTALDEMEVSNGTLTSAQLPTSMNSGADAERYRVSQLPTYINAGSDMEDDASSPSGLPKYMNTRDSVPLEDVARNAYSAYGKSRSPTPETHSNGYRQSKSPSPGRNGSIYRASKSPSPEPVGSGYKKSKSRTPEPKSPSMTNNVIYGTGNQKEEEIAYFYFSNPAGDKTKQANDRRESVVANPPIPEKSLDIPSPMSTLRMTGDKEQVTFDNPGYKDDY